MPSSSVYLPVQYNSSSSEEMSVNHLDCLKGLNKTERERTWTCKEKNACFVWLHYDTNMSTHLQESPCIGPAIQEEILHHWITDRGNLLTITIPSPPTNSPSERASHSNGAAHPAGKETDDLPSTLFDFKGEVRRVQVLHLSFQGAGAS